MMNKIKSFVLFWTLIFVGWIWWLDISPSEGWYLLETLPNYLKHKLI